MGFLDKLKESVHSFYNNADEFFGGAGQGIYDLATAPFDDNKDISKAWEGFGQMFGAGGETYDKWAEVPGFKQGDQALEKTSEFLNAVYREGVSRPISTLGTFQMEGLEGTGEEGFSAVLGAGGSYDWFDGDAWERAYDRSKNVSPGQAVTALYHGMDYDELQKAKARGDFYEKPELRYLSGSIDFASVIFFDPTIVAGKAAKAGRISYIRPMTSDKIQAGALDNYMDSARLGRVKDIIYKAESPDEIRLQLLNDNTYGATAAHVLYNTRFDEELLNTSIRAVYGEKEALTDLNRYNKALIDSGESAAAGTAAAAALGRRAAVVQATARGRIGTSLERPEDWGEYVDMLRTQDDLFKQVAPFSPEIMRDLGLGGNLLGTPQMRASWSSAARTALHKQGTEPFTVIGYGPKTMMNKMLTSNKRVHGIDVNDTNSDQVLRTYLERAGLPETQRAQILARYMAAGSQGLGAKQAVVVQAEEAVIRNFGSMYKLDRDDLDKIVEKANDGRGKARYIMSNRQEFASADLQKAYGTKQGEEVLTFTDDDGSYHRIVAPVLESQMANTMPLADPGQLNRVYRAYTSSVAHRVGKDTSDLIEDKLDGFYRLWKPAVLLRLGWPVRAMSDEGARFVALQGILPLALSAGRGLRSTPGNMMERGGRAYDAVIRGMNAERIKSLRYQRDSSIPIDERYRSLEDAFTDGRLSREELQQFAGKAAQTGNVDEMAAVMWNRVEEGLDQPEDFGRFLSERALKNSGLDWYTNPIRQTDLIKEVESRGQTTLNPLKGEVGKAPKDAQPLAKSGLAMRDPESGWIDNDAIYGYVHANLDSFLGRDSAVLSVKALEDGNFALQVLGSKADADRRWKEAKNALRGFITEDGRSQFVRPQVLSIDGRNVEIEGVLAGSGSHYEKLASSDHHWASYIMDQASLAEDRAHVSMGWSNGIDAVNNADSYPLAWERAAMQLANDRVAQQFLGGRTIDDVMDWVENSDDGKRWATLTRFNGDLEERVARIWVMTDEYVPDAGDLRKKVLNQRHTYSDLHEAVKDDALKPQVHGERVAYALGSHKALRLARKGVSKAMKGLGSLPNDKLLRYPFFDARYRAHMEDLLKNEYRQLDEATDDVSVYTIGELQESARRRALADINKWFYNSDSASAAIQGMRHLTPFGNAWQDAMRAWSGIAFREKPQAFGYLWNASQTLEKSGLIVDGAGRELRIENGKEVWYEVNAETGKRTKYTGDPQEGRYLQIHLPSWLAPDSFGENVKVPTRINKKSFNTFLSLYPGAGPIVQVPVSEIAKRNAEVGDSQLAKMILPYGPQDGIVKQFLPTALREAVEAWNGESDSKFAAQAKAIWDYENARYANGERSTKPTMGEATDKTRDLKLIRIMSAMTLPVSAQYMNPYQPYVDSYRQLMAKDFTTADPEFVRLYGEDYFALTARVTKSSEGLPATMSSVRARRKYEALIEKYPDLAGAIVGDTSGAFSKAAYEFQKANETAPGSGKKQRSVLSLRDSTEDMESRLGWMKFTAMMDTIDAELADRGLTSLRAEGAEDLKEAKDRLVDSMKWADEESTVRSAWYEEYSTTDRSKGEERLASLRELVSDHNLIKRDDWQGVADYLIAWDEFSAELTARDAAGGAKTLEAKSNRDLAELWQDTAFTLKERNLSFSALYNRYLFNLSPEAIQDGDPFSSDSGLDLDFSNFDDTRDDNPFDSDLDFEAEEESLFDEEEEEF